MAAPDALAMVAEKAGDKLFAVNADGSRPVSWTDLITKRNRIAYSLSQRLPGDAVAGAVYARNCPEWFVAQVCLDKLGLRFAPINWHLVGHEIAYIANDCDADVVFFGVEFASTVAAIKAETPRVKLWVCLDGLVDDAVSLSDLIAEVPVDAKPPAHSREGGQVGYTGGSTGKPKGAFRANKPASPSNIISEWGFDRMFPSPVQLVAAPLYHALPLVWYNIGKYFGTTFVCMPMFEPASALAAIERFKVNGCFLPPILMKRLVQLPQVEKSRYDFSSMKNIMSGGAACPTSVKKGIVDMFGPVLRELYGASELGGVTIMDPETLLKKPLSCGKPADGYDVVILDDNKEKVTAPKVQGEIFAKGGNFDGYHKNEEKTKELMYNDYISVGDVGYFDEDGYLYISDRKSDMIVSGGANIYPIETEELLHGHDMIEDVAVFGVPDNDYGERVHACIKLVPGAIETARSILGWCDGKIAKFKLPREADVSFHTDDFPRSDAGKLRKKDLKQVVLSIPRSKL